jgi:hypothetical protein
VAVKTITRKHPLQKGALSSQSGLKTPCSAQANRLAAAAERAPARCSNFNFDLAAHSKKKRSSQFFLSRPILAPAVALDPNESSKTI